MTMGAHGIALFGQLSQMQTLLITLGGAGLATATRVILARNDLSGKARDQAQSWLLWVPAAFSLGLVVVITALNAGVSQIVLGSSAYGLESIFAAAGIPLAVAGQIVLAAAQAGRETSRLVASALTAALVGGAVVAALMATGDSSLAALSLVCGPGVQLLVIVFICRTARRGFLAFPRLDKIRRKEVIVLASASLVLGALAAGAELASRSTVVHFRGLIELAPYQPVALLVTTSMSLILGAVATSSLVELASIDNRGLIGERITEIAKRILPFFGLIISLVIALSPFAVSILFVPTLVHSSTALIVFAFAGEPLRALAWIAGSCFLPLGQRRTWLVVGLLTVSVQAAVALVFASTVGVFAIVAGLVSASVVTLAATLLALKRSSIIVEKPAVILSVCISIIVSGLPLLSYAILGVVSPGAIFSAGLIGIYMVVYKKLQSNLREVA
ncbi:hypothetical protein [Arthrobacter bambusae]|uniref:hypothetical protein n=1 Tax=Arthrobacter bambusae TaxID=1338426 RepID=UPI002786586F|nr:hypothetical protein [Arthrobacter bambusae]MDQ0031441.1 O-antigen/teichoic acid export membrane protein [Arthrobacter bambusae]MDQ0099671.1 O-antigen/teichoic acid export membrane protein [Arthrobacter bambusae]